MAPDNLITMIMNISAAFLLVLLIVVMTRSVLSEDYHQETKSPSDAALPTTQASDDPDTDSTGRGEEGIWVSPELTKPLPYPVPTPQATDDTPLPESKELPQSKPPASTSNGYQRRYPIPCDF